MKLIYAFLISLCLIPLSRASAQNEFELRLALPSSIASFSPTEASFRHLAIETSHGPLFLQIKLHFDQIQQVKIGFDGQTLESIAKSRPSSRGRQTVISVNELQRELIPNLILSLDQLALSRNQTEQCLIGFLLAVEDLPPLEYTIESTEDAEKSGVLAGRSGKLAKMDMMLLTYHRSISSSDRIQLRLEYGFNPLLRKQSLMLVFNAKF